MSRKELVAGTLALSIALGSACAAFAATGKGTLSTYSCSTDSKTVSAFVNISGQPFVRSAVPFDTTCSAGAGGDWNGLNDPFQSLTFDVQGPPSNGAKSHNNFYVIVSGTSAGEDVVQFFRYNDIASEVDLSNGWTRYTIKNADSMKIKRVIFHQYPSATPGLPAVVFGNITLNGNVRPVQDTKPAACPPMTGDALSCL